MAEWENRFDRLLKAMSEAEPRKASERKTATDEAQVRTRRMLSR